MVSASPASRQPARTIARFLATLWAIGLRVVLLVSFALFAVGGGALAILFPWPAVILAVIVAIGLRSGGRNSGAYGTARFAGGSELVPLVNAQDGLVLGRAKTMVRRPAATVLAPLFQAPLSQSAAAIRPLLMPKSKREKRRGELLRLAEFTHLATFAPTGAGKGVSQVSTNLHLYASPVVVNDLKGDLFSQHAAHRRKAFGHQVERIDFWGVKGPGTAQWNPLDAIDPKSPHALDDCRSMADAMVVREEHEKDPHFNDSAVLVIHACIAFAVFYGNAKERNLQTVRSLITNPAAFASMLEVLRNSDLAGGMLRRLGDSLGHFRDRELGSVMTTSGRHTAFLDSTAVAAGMQRTSFDLDGLKKGTLDLFVIVPPDQMSPQKPLFRLIFSSLIRSVTRHGLDESNKVLFILDEAGQLGKMQTIEDALTLYRAHGIRCWLFYQSIDQVRKCFAHENILLSNVGTVSYFGTNDYDTAELISKRMGDATITTVSRQRGSSWSRPSGNTIGESSSGGQYSTNDSETRSEAARNLMKPDEILRMPSEDMIIFSNNLPPIHARRLIYYRDPEFKGSRVPGRARLGMSAAVMAASYLITSALLAGAAFSLSFGGGSSTGVEAASIQP